MKIKPRKGIAKEGIGVVNSEEVVVSPQTITVIKGGGIAPTAPVRPIEPEVEKEEKVLGLGETGQGRGIGQIAIVILGVVVLILLLKKV